MEDFFQVLRRRGFVWGPSPEIYGGVSGFYSYGPMGALLKRNVEDYLRKEFRKRGFWEVEGPTVNPEIVWIASGHVERFVDPVTRCEKCGKEWRADKLLEEALGETVSTTDPEELTELIRKHNIRCPECGGELSGVYEFNLMLKTEIFGGKTAYLRPETATVTYLLFPQLYQAMRKKLPLQVFQIGRAYRNEISPRKFLLRQREFTQAEAQTFVVEEPKVRIPEGSMRVWPAGEDEREVDYSDLTSVTRTGSPYYVLHLIWAWEITRKVLPEERLRFRQHADSEKAHYALDAWDLEFKTERFGWVEVCGVHDRGTYDLSRHQEYSGDSMEVDGKVPRILEIAFGVDRLLYSVLESSYTDLPNTKGFAFPPFLAPVKVAVFPLVKKEEFTSRAREIYEKLLPHMPAIYDESGSIGRRYARSEEVGVPFAVTVDGQTLEDGTVTVRERDTGKQVRIHEKELLSYLLSRV